LTDDRGDRRGVILDRTVSRDRETAPPMLHQRVVVFESLGISAGDFRCRARVEPEGPE
jgi:hypothetical protein